MSASIKLTTYRNKIKKIEALLPAVLAVDRLAARREIQRLSGRKGRVVPDQKSMKRLDALEKRLQASVKKRDRRKAHLPQLRFNEELPIFAKKDEIIEAIARHPVIVVSGETGSGKTTQLPKYCLAAGRGVDGLIGCTQPRRIAATTVSRRIAEELGQEPGQAVGYKIRFKDRTDKDTYIKIMTDGILLAETQGDRYLSAYDTIIVDEAHERSLNIDFILGILQTLVSKRDDLKLIITSATIDTEKFSKAFRNAPIIEVSGRMYPVEVQYIATATDPSQNGELTHVELAVQVVKRVLNQSRAGDILVFMPTEQDIRETCELLEAQTPPETRVMPLFARLTAAEQSRVFARLSRRKIIVATNVAETSITIPGIKYVVDSGLARISRYSPTTRTTSLPVVPVSRSSCDQRKGRCGRVQSGVCLRLYSEDDYQARPQFTPPEILRANLAEVILRMISLNLGDVSDFPFIDRPDVKNIKDGFNLLSELGAITKRQSFEFGMRNAECGKKKRGRRYLNSELGMRNAERKNADHEQREEGEDRN
ncbi:MAG: ATP-dependent RNA helicase HrpA, partial [Deltaproteobacteria bacterium]|nr:ATP-dependent RNA helicase HrpA [Deltaproteobacteria bacterium]